MTHQRRAGQDLQVWKVATVTDRRGNRTKVAVADEPNAEKGWVIPQRSSRGEVPGQLVIDVIRIGISADTPDVDLWSRVRYAGRDYDVVTPPEYHHGTRHTRHYTLDLRRRP